MKSEEKVSYHAWHLHYFSSAANPTEIEWHIFLLHFAGGFHSVTQSRSTSVEQPFSGILYGQVPYQGSNEDWRKYRPAGEWFRGPGNRSHGKD